MQIQVEKTLITIALPLVSPSVLSFDPARRTIAFWVDANIVIVESKVVDVETGAMQRALTIGTP